MNHAELQPLITALVAINRAVAALETEAAAALAVSDTGTYRSALRQKALLLAEMADTVAPHLATLPGSLSSVAGRIRAMSASAAAALDLDSSFYMSALLYPEDHTPGTPNDLALFIESLQAR